MSKRTLVIAVKEFFHIINDTRTLSIVFLMPVLQLLLFGYALRMELQELKVGIVDYDNSSHSASLTDHLRNNDFFKISTIGIDEIEKLFLERKIKAALIIGKDFGSELNKGKTVPVQLIIDASDQNVANFALNYMNSVISKFNKELSSTESGLDLRIRNWYNPQGKSTYFIVPGILALVLIMICALLTSIAITKEKETGTLEQLLVSAVKADEIILGKVLPYILLGFIDAILVVVVSVFVFHVPFNGSILLLSGLSLLYIICALSLGLLISTVATSQQNAMMMAIAATLLPSMFLSGFFFPVRSMPYILQKVSYLVPARYYLQIARGVMLKGNTFSELLFPAGALIVMSILLFIVSVRKFKVNIR